MATTIKNENIMEDKSQSVYNPELQAKLNGYKKLEKNIKFDPKNTKEFFDSLKKEIEEDIDKRK